MCLKRLLVVVSLSLGVPLMAQPTGNIQPLPTLGEAVRSEEGTAGGELTGSATLGVRGASGVTLFEGTEIGMKESRGIQLPPASSLTSGDNNRLRSRAQPQIVSRTVEEEALPLRPLPTTRPTATSGFNLARGGSLSLFSDSRGAVLPQAGGVSSGTGSTTLPGSAPGTAGPVGQTTIPQNRGSTTIF